MASLTATDNNLPACNACRNRKLKCSREQPTCFNCKRLDLTCEYDPHKNKPGMKSGVVDQLTRRIEYLEHKLYEDRDSDGQRPLSLSSDPAPLPRMASGDTSTPAFGGALSMLAQEIQKLNSNIAVLSTAIVPQANLPNVVSQQADVGRGRKRARSDGDSASEVLDVSRPKAAQDAQQEIAVDILAGDNLEALVDAYFVHVARWIPMVHETTFRHKLQQRKDGEPLPLVLHAMLIAVLRILNSSKQLLSVDDLERQIERARSKVILGAGDGLSVEGLQSLVIIAFTYLGNGEHTKAWPIIGSLTRSAEFLQLSVEEPERETPAALLRASLPLQSADWIEEEERRRLFWNIFILDRICSITTGCKVGFTGDNVWRRLPLCGTHWNTDTPATSPYFGIWDKSAAKIGNSIAFLPEHYPSPELSTMASNGYAKGYAAASQPHASPSAIIDMSTVGAFAYYVESLESLCRINIYFLQQKCNFNNRHEVSSWLTRFKELDLRLVHWKMFLPAKWRDPDIPPAETGALDPNMTLAHITHNTSMILLHQRIGYPDPQLKNLKLPNLYSAETCHLAAVETATIARKYLTSSSGLMPLSPHFSFCLCISARVLLVHCQHYGDELDPNFWALVEMLEEASRRWFTTDNEQVSLSGQFATQLRQLYDQLQEDPIIQIDALGSFEGRPMRKQGRSFAAPAGVPLSMRKASVSPSISVSHHANGPTPLRHNLDTTSPSDSMHSKTHTVPTKVGPRDDTSPSSCSNPGGILRYDGIGGADDGDNLSNILETLGAQSFIDLDRVISFSGMDFGELPTGGI